jgi:hypothetical protein
MMIPHAVWYDNTKVTYRPELSYRNPLYADSLKAFTTYLARLNVMLQAPGRHVADIAVLYPVQSLLSEHYFYTEKGPANIDGRVDPANQFYKNAVADIDYVDIGGWLLNSAGHDFTYIHPEALDDKCLVSVNHLDLQNNSNKESYRIIILPSCSLISASNLEKVADFYKSGGIVLFTTRLPRKSLEPGKDNEIESIIASIFPGYEKDSNLVRQNEKGGKACFIPHPDDVRISEFLQNAAIEFDVTYPLNPEIQYIHKVTGNRNIYFFANKGNTEIQTEAVLRGAVRLDEWDPHTGEIRKIETRQFKNSSESSFTRVKLKLKPYHSLFFVEKKAGRE